MTAALHNASAFNLIYNEAMVHRALSITRGGTEVFCEAVKIVRIN